MAEESWLRVKAWLRIHLNHQTHEMIHSDIVHGLCQGMHGANGSWGEPKYARYGWQHKSTNGGNRGHSLATRSMRSTLIQTGKQTFGPAKTERSDSAPMAPKTITGDQFE